MSRAVTDRSQTLWLDQLSPGQPLALPEFDCTAELVAGYADLFDARHPIHVDPEFARTTRYGRPIAHGPLVVAKVLAMLTDVFGEGLRVMLGIGGWEFHAPVLVGDRVTTECVVAAINAREGSSAGAVELAFRILVPGGRLAQEGRSSVLVSRAPAAGA